MNTGMRIFIYVLAFAIVFTGVGFLVSDEYTVGNVMPYTGIGVACGLILALFQFLVDKKRGRKFLEK